ncbi:12884_t:CDS:2 [Ambispora leptoticha]|uniref:12884_t:CDS:1 n=1 Tax=Ambispora leptoticha TaxID=144679 RepID=A0A9N8W782_9GLOM|nr:12884_t:CDS:2 [Ambispora leptoticha]
MDSLNYSLKDTNLSGKVVIMTGVNDGIGKNLACYISSFKPKRLILPACDRSSSGRVLDYIRAKTGEENAEIWDMDLENFDSVRKFGRRIVDEIGETHVLINNAEFWSKELIKTKDGLEKQFQINYLGHFLLTNILIETLKKSGTPEFPARIIHISPSLNRRAVIDRDNFDGSKSNKMFELYNNSKFMNIVFSNELNRRLALTKVVSVVICPGIIKSHLSQLNGIHQFWKTITIKLNGQKASRKSSFNVLYPIFSPDIQKNRGIYFENGRVTKVNPKADDVALGKELWKVSDEIVQSVLRKYGIPDGEI